MEGKLKVRCGSLAKMGKPVADLPPLTTQLFEPMPLSRSCEAFRLPLPTKSAGAFGKGKGEKSRAVPCGMMGLSTKG